MTIKFAHLADAHLGYEQYRLPYRAEEFRLAFEEAIKKAIEEKVDFILIAGDLFHRSNPSPQTIKEAIDILELPKREKIPVFAIEGNHDRTQKRISAYHLLESLGLIHLLGFSEEKKENKFQTTEKVNGRLLVKGVFEKGGKSIEIYGIKYMSAAWFERNRLADYFRPQGDAILMLHQGIREMMEKLHLETQRDYFEISLNDLPEGFLYYAMGHIHKRWETNRGFGIVAYPGSLQRWDFGDYKMRYRWDGLKFKRIAGEDKGFLIVEDFKPRFIGLDVRPFYDIKIKGDEKTVKEELKKLSPKIPREAFLRVSLEWERPFDVTFLHDIFNVRYLYIRTKFGRRKPVKGNVTGAEEFFTPLERRIISLAGEKDFEEFDEVIKLILEGEAEEADRGEKAHETKTETSSESGKEAEKKREKPKRVDLTLWLSKR
ncbi:DNA double-strand break repair protein Mre11 [Thermococcus sp.]